MLETWTEAQLAEIGLRRDGEAVTIDIPADANIFSMALGRQLRPAGADRPAMLFERPDGRLETWSFAQIDAAATTLAAHLRGLGYGRGDLVGLHTGMRPETAIGHMAVCKLGGTAVTLSQLYGSDALAHALNDCEARCLLTTEAAWANLRDEAGRFGYLTDILVSESAGTEPDLRAILDSAAPPGFEPMIPPC